jgi:hypothetical protein
VDGGRGVADRRVVDAVVRRRQSDPVPLFLHSHAVEGVLRGMGAPGFIAYWLAAVVTLLEVSRRFAPSVFSLSLFVAQVDFAFLMFAAGIYKLTAGYPRNHGMELGLCNPMWGYWWRSYVKRRPSSPVFWTMNQLAWTTEVASALLMLIPATRELGALLIIVSFISSRRRFGWASSRRW